MTRAADQLDQPVGHRERERGIVDVGVDLVHLDPRRVTFSRSVEQRLVGIGVVERLPLVAIAETPRSGTNSTVGALAAFSFRRHDRAISRHSSGVVRISVIVGLWT